MGKDVSEVEQALRYPCDVKVHSLMCGELTKLVDRVTRVIPAIESARPGCKSGIQALCSLSIAIDKAKLLLQHCSESSKLYLAITGESVLLRCERAQKELDLNLSQIQNMVPQLLASQISEIVNDLRDAKFIMESSEQEAGRTLLALLKLDKAAVDSAEVSEFEAFQVAALRLHITSPKALLIEKRSIRKLLEKVRDTDQRKQNILKYLIYLVKKYGNLVGSESIENVDSQFKGSLSSTNPNKIVDPKPSMGSGGEKGQSEVYRARVPPEEFRCPISSKLMFDPVVIASGQTYERMWIEKWLSEGHDTCPKTQKKLSHLSLTPNSCLKDLISNWCRAHDVTILDPCAQPIPSAFSSWSISSSSISSCASSLNDVPAQILDRETADYANQSDISNISICSSDASYCVISSHNKSIASLKECHSQIFSWSGDFHGSQSFVDFRHEVYMNFLSKLAELPLDSQHKAVEDVKIFMKDNDEVCHTMHSNGFVEALMSFMTYARDLSNVSTQKTGAQILLAFLSNSRNEVPSLEEDAFHLLASFLDSEISKEAMAILQMLSRHWCFKPKIVASGALHSIIKILDSQVGEPLVHAVKILYDLSSHSEIKSHLISSGCISKLVPLLVDNELSGTCIKILQNLCDTDIARVAIAETNGCIASIVELLDTVTYDEQEHAVAILLSLCIQSLDYCQSVMNEGVIPALVNISVNGNSTGKEIAMKLLLLLRDLRHTNDPPDSSDLEVGSTSELSPDSSTVCKERRSASKASGFFKRKMSIFSKTRTLSLY
ncbi:U-box domain-containing protein 5-like [Tasmannia lanceolata]|uniref:U-box domain-containing protein 5-like n=1 Tax=Tasmannia lanceolata TaxID=3420 RepID=UPI004063FBC1